MNKAWNDTSTQELISHLWRRYAHALRLSETLGGSIQTWVTEHPITGRAEIAKDRLSWQLYLDVHEPPLDEWCFTFGDAIHNLRACLDNVAWALANTSGPPKQPRDVQFPIVEKGGVWDSQKYHIEELPKGARSAIESVQPFNRDSDASDSARRDPLLLLADLSNTDKHRFALEPTVGYESIAQTFAVEFQSEEDAAADGAPTVELDLRPLSEGGVVMRQTTRHKIASVKGTFNLEARVVVTHPDHQPVGATEILSNLAKYVKIVIDHVLSATEKS